MGWGCCSPRAGGGGIMAARKLYHSPSFRYFIINGKLPAVVESLFPLPPFSVGLPCLLFWQHIFLYPLHEQAILKPNGALSLAAAAHGALLLVAPLAPFHDDTYLPPSALHSRG